MNESWEQGAAVKATLPGADHPHTQQETRLEPMSNQPSIEKGKAERDKVPALNNSEHNESQRALQRACRCGLKG